MGRKTKTAVVVGGGVAGATCAAETAALTADNTDTDVQVVLISPSPAVRVATAGALRCEVEVSDEPAEAWARAAGVRVVRDAAVAVQARTILLASGDTVAFDACCIASGARPDVPAVFRSSDPALNNRILTIRDTDSVATLRAAVSGARRVAVVGNGGIALELAHEIVACDVVWVIRDSHVGHSFFDASVGEALVGFLGKSKDAGFFGRVENGGENGGGRDGGGVAGGVLGSGAGPDWLGRKEKPIFFDADGNEVVSKRPGGNVVSDRGDRLRIERDCEVTAINMGSTGDGFPVTLSLSNGSKVLCDYVICATGVIPNVEWLGHLSRVPVGSSPSSTTAGESTVDVSGGVLVSAGNMQSIGRKDIFAAGDCATIVRSIDMDVSCGNNWFQMRLWTQAAIAGRVAAAGMSAALVGAESEARGLEFDIFAHATRFFGERVALLGRYSAQGLREGYRIVEGGNDERFVRVVLEEGKVRGAVLIGDVDLAETYENLILDGLDVSHIASEELVDPQVDLEDYFD